MKLELVSWVIFNRVERVLDFAKQQELRLAEAIAINDLVTVEQLLQRGIDPNICLVGETQEPLIFLVFEKSWFTFPLERVGHPPKTSYRITAKEECLRLLVKYGADPNVRDSLGRTVLEIAIVWCLPNVVKLLLLQGADPNVRDSNSQTPLMKTVILGIEDARPILDKLQIINYLIDSGAEINAQAPDGKTALMYAVGNSRLKIVEFLVSTGASLTITDHQGNCAADIINQSINQQQQIYLRKIITQRRLNIVKYKYQQLISGGDRLLAPIINHQKKEL